ncbi:MAG: DUF935 domain-containing protein [Desulfobulbaceae bacterium]|nr:DUF935 domain-containing protein [Desulfobulbaceae bacterium]
MADQDKKTPEPNTDEIAAASNDIDIFAGWTNRMENPDPTLRTEANGKGLKLYDEVDRDAHAGAVLQSRYLAVTGKEWEVLPADDSEAAKAVAETVETGLGGCNFSQFCQELLQAILYGYFVGEVMWTVRKGQIMPKKIRAKHPRRFVFAEDRSLRLLTRTNMIAGEETPDRKFIVFSYGSSDNPYGKGLGQKLWWPVWFKKHGIKFWLVFLEKFGSPTAVGKYPSGTDKKDQDALLEAIDAIQQETGVKIPDTMSIDLLEATRGGKVTYETLCDYMDRQISKAVLSQTASTEGTPGKLGNDDAQDGVRQEIVKADADLLCEVLNETVVRWIADFNHPNLADYPQLRIRTAEEQDLKALADRDKVLVKDIGLPVAKRYFYDTYGIPEPEKGAEVVGGQIAGGRDPGNDLGGYFAEADLDMSPAPTLDALGAKTLAQADMGKFMQPIERALAKAGSLEEFRDSLLDLGAEMNESDLGNLMQRAFVVADLAGRFDVER